MGKFFQRIGPTLGYLLKPISCVGAKFWPVTLYLGSTFTGNYELIRMNSTASDQWQVAVVSGHVEKDGRTENERTN
jgi:hypothetical protein